MMTLHLLILEDNPDDAELAVKELERKGFDVKWTRVDTEEAFRKALSEKPDLILADYSIPSFDGLAALKVYRQLKLDIPLIIVSGTIGEEVAVECMKSGATDYVFKDNLSRLDPVVKRALEEMIIYRKSRQTEEALRESEEKFRAVLAAVPDLMIVLDAEGRYRDIFTAAPDLLIAPADQLLGKTIHEVMPEKNAQQIQNVINQTLSTGKLQQIEYVLDIDGVNRWFAGRVAKLKFQNTECVLWSARDITEGKQAERELQERMNELETFYRVTLGREERVIELKQEVNELLEQLGNKKKYGDYT
jgi:PAS domain S-box-containing protein